MIVLIKVAYYATSSARLFSKSCSKSLKIRLLFDNYATFSYCVLKSKKHKTSAKTKIIYLLLIKHHILFISSYTLALIKHN